MSVESHVSADLMSSACFEIHFQKAELSVGFQRFVAGNDGFAARYLIPIGSDRLRLLSLSKKSFKVADFGSGTPCTRQR